MTSGLVIFKDYFRFKMITSQNVPCKAQVKNFFIPQGELLKKKNKQGLRIFNFKRYQRNGG